MSFPRSLSSCKRGAGIQGRRGVSRNARKKWAASFRRRISYQPSLRAPQEPSSHHALSLGFERGTRNILNIFMSYQEWSLLVRRTGRRWLLATWSESLSFWLLFGMAQPIQLDLPSPPHSPRGVVTMGIVTASSLPHAPYRHVSKGPNIITKILQKSPKISQKSHSPQAPNKASPSYRPLSLDGRGPG